MSLDEIAGKIAGLGIPGLILVIAVSATTYTGAAAISVALAALGGPFGMIGGAISLTLIGLTADAITKWGLEKVLNAVLKQLAEEGHTRREILRTIEGYSISEGMTLKLKKHVNSFFNGR